MFFQNIRGGAICVALVSASCQPRIQEPSQEAVADHTSSKKLLKVSLRGHLARTLPSKTDFDNWLKKRDFDSYHLMQIDRYIYEIESDDIMMLELIEKNVQYENLRSTFNPRHPNDPTFRAENNRPMMDW